VHAGRVLAHDVESVRAPSRSAGWARPRFKPSAGSAGEAATPGRTETILLLAVLAVAFVLRIWGGGFGLPNIYHPDEGFEVYRAIRLGTGSFDLERIGKGGYYLLLFVEYVIYFLVLLVQGVVRSVHEFAYFFVADPSPFWRIGRATTACLGTATVFLIWLQGRRMGGSRAGLLGAWFLAFSFQHVTDSHFVTVDVPMAFFTFWAVFLVVEDASSRSRMKPWVFALVAAGAILNKLPAAVLFVPYFLAAFWKGGWRGESGVLSRSTLHPVFLTSAIYVVVNPGIVLHFGSLAADVLQTLFGGVSSQGEYAGVKQETSLWRFYTEAVLSSQGPALLALSLFGAWFGVVRQSRAAILHVSFLVPFFVLIAGASTPHLYYWRYIVPLLPGLCLLAGIALDDLVRRLAPSAGGAMALVTAILLVVEPGLADVRANRRHCRVDTRTLACEWIETNVPAGERVLLEGFSEDASQLLVPLEDLEDNVIAMIFELRKSDPGKARYWEMKLKTREGPFFDLLTVRHFEKWGSLEEYARRGVDVVIVAREKFVPGASDVSKLDPEVVRSRQAFYDELSRSPRASRVASFDASEDGLPGLDLEIWRLGRADPAR
jgi:hypothetical protein